MSAPAVSVILPVYNGAAFVADAIASVMAQSFADFELIAIDDGSTDRSPGILAQQARDTPRLRVITQTNRGAGAARNAGLAVARAPLVAFIDADDLWHPGLLAKSVAVFADAPEVRLVFPLCRYIDESGAPTGVVSTAGRPRYAAADLMVANPVHSGSGVMVRRAAMEEAGGFDPALRSCIDLDAWVRVAGPRPAAIAAIPTVLVDYRRRAGQITSDWRRMRDGWTRTAEKAALAGYGLDPGQMRAARARLALVWAGTAYEAGDYATARRLVADIWRHDPRFAAGDRLARIRTASVLAACLPSGLHARIRHAFNARP